MNIYCSIGTIIRCVWTVLTGIFTVVLGQSFAVHCQVLAVYGLPYRNNIGRYIGSDGFCFIVVLLQTLAP